MAKKLPQAGGLDRINFYLTREKRVELTRAAKQAGLTRNYLVNKVIDQFLKGQQ